MNKKSDFSENIVEIKKKHQGNLNLIILTKKQGQQCAIMAQG